MDKRYLFHHSCESCDMKCFRYNKIIIFYIPCLFKVVFVYLTFSPESDDLDTLLTADDNSKHCGKWRHFTCSCNLSTLFINCRMSPICFFSSSFELFCVYRDLQASTFCTKTLIVYRSLTWAVIFY